MNVNISDSKACGPFQLSPQLLQALSPLGAPQQVAKDEQVFSQGEPCRGLFLVRSGFLRIAMQSPSGSEVFARVLGPGCVAGLPASLCSQPYGFAARALEASELLFIEQSMVVQFLRLRPDLCMEIVGIMSQELAEMNERRSNFKGCRDCGCAFVDACEHHMGG